MYAGLLPMLIRYSHEKTGRNTQMVNAASSMDTAESIHMNLGSAFVKATKPTPLPLGEQLRVEC
jgi:hypothetical protein